MNENELCNKNKCLFQENKFTNQFWKVKKHLVYIKNNIIDSVVCWFFDGNK